MGELMTTTPQQWLDKITEGTANPTEHAGTHAAPGREAQVAALVEELNTRHLLVSLRQQAHLTQQEVADRLGQTRPAVSQAEIRPLETMAIGTFLRHVEALGYRLNIQAALEPIN